MSNCMYEFRGGTYSASQMNSMINRHKGDQIEFAVGHRILSRILYTGGMPKLAYKFARIADLFEDSITGYYSTGTEKEQSKSRKKYNKNIRKLGKINALEIHNIDSYLIDLIQGTLGVGKVPYSEGRLIDFSVLTEEQCVAIANNFKRDIKGKDRLPYQAASKSM